MKSRYTVYENYLILLFEEEGLKRYMIIQQIFDVRKRKRVGVYQSE